MPMLYDDLCRQHSRTRGLADDVAYRYFPLSNLSSLGYLFFCDTVVRCFDYFTLFFLFFLRGSAKGVREREERKDGCGWVGDVSWSYRGRSTVLRGRWISKIEKINKHQTMTIPDGKINGSISMTRR